MQQNLLYTVALVIGTSACLSACAPSVTVSDLYRPGFGIRAVPEVSLDAPYGGTPDSYGAQQPCLMSSPRCTPDKQLQWAEANQR